MHQQEGIICAPVEYPLEIMDVPQYVSPQEFLHLIRLNVWLDDVL